MAYRGQGQKVQKVMVQPINLIFRYLQNRLQIQVWLYEQVNMRIEGCIIGFDEYMNLVLDDAEEIHSKTKSRKQLGRIMLKGDNITLLQSVFQEPAEEERDGRKKKYPSPQKTRSESSERRTREKKREDGKWRDYDRYYERNELYREKYDWRRGRSKSRSKSRGLSRSRSRSRGRSKDRDPNRNVEHRERSKFKSERNDLESSYVPVSAPPPNSSEQYSSGAQSIPSTVTVIAPAHHSENTTESWSNYYNNHSSSNSFGRNLPPKRRCRDYDGKNPHLFSYCAHKY
ncbi:RNA-binding protein 27 [Saguinus oedipus]|uniref:Small nuclear ribonucleoprotein E n=1 Tax=Saguinus oedipus TaxID=9490 RepID=A0ABQ9W4Z7_SAGOE|nr:RNA-binding protein 27 [Saguinus oedipus]